MATVPVDGTLGTQRAVTELNDEIFKLKQQLSRLSVEELQKDMEALQKTVDAIEHRRRIPERGYRSGPSAVRMFLNEDLFWSSPILGGVTVSISFVSTSGAVADDMYIILVDASLGDVTLSLPAASAHPGRVIQIKKIDSSVNAVIIDPDGADLIEEETSLELLFYGEAVPIVSDGISKWSVL